MEGASKAWKAVGGTEKAILLLGSDLEHPVRERDAFFGPWALGNLGTCEVGNGKLGSLENWRGASVERHSISYRSLAPEGGSLNGRRIVGTVCLYVGMFVV
jgi:hypothetical protein